jgi:hypothetical protein
LVCTVANNTWTSSDPFSSFRTVTFRNQSPGRCEGW